MSPANKIISYRSRNWKGIEKQSVPMVADGFDVGTYLKDPLVRLAAADPKAFQEKLESFSVEETIDFFNKGPLKIRLNNSGDQGGKTNR